MAEDRKKEAESGVLGRLAERGEDALTRVMDELGRNPRVTDALGRAMTAKGRVDETTRKTLATVGLAAADEIKDLRTQLERLEKRLAKLETGGAQASSSPGAKAGRTSAAATKASGGTARKEAGGTPTKSSAAARTKSGGTSPRPRPGGSGPTGPAGAP
jgi:hypothetical protein